jgi:ABC-2 type transport system permease protein
LILSGAERAQVLINGYLAVPAPDSCHDPASLFAVGLCIAAFIRSDAVANGIGGILFFALLFFGGLCLPRPLMPAVLLDISNWTPLGASVNAMQRAMQGAFPSLQSILVLAAYTLVFWLPGGALF